MKNKFENKNYKRWFLQGTIGIIFLGFGLCLLVESGFHKHSEAPVWEWVGYGVIALVVVMSGLITMIDSIRYRIRYEQEQHI